MIRTFDQETLEALDQLLAQPDAEDLPRRSHRLCCPGEPNRRATRLPAIFMAWLQWRCLAVDGEEQAAPAALCVTPRLVRGAAIRRPHRVAWQGGTLAPASAGAAASSVNLANGPSSLEALA
jgi:hypothetical protein